MPRDDLLNEKKEERKTISSGIRWPRFVFVIIGFFSLIELIFESEGRLSSLSTMMLCWMLYFVFYKIRRLQFDSSNLYIVKGKEETVVPYSSIISIKKSSTKVNGSRYYKILYKDEFSEEHIRRYFPRIFGESKNFIAAVKKANPGVIHWDHPFFNH